MHGRGLEIKRRKIKIAIDFVLLGTFFRCLLVENSVVFYTHDRDFVTPKASHEAPAESRLGFWGSS